MRCIIPKLSPSRLPCLVAAAIAAVSMVATSPAARAQGYYTFTDLGTLGGTSSVGYDINNAGVVVGRSTLSTGQVAATLWHGTTAFELGSLGGIGGVAYGINNRGQIVGMSENAFGVSHATLWDELALTDLGTLGTPSNPNQQQSVFSAAFGINDRGDIVGTSWRGVGNDRADAVLWSGGSITDLSFSTNPQPYFSSANAINNQGLAVGGYYSQGWRTGGLETACVGSYGYQSAVLWSPGGSSSLPPLNGTCSQAQSINEAGIAVGATTVEDSIRGSLYGHAALWDGTGTVDLGTLGGFNSFAYDVNNAGQVVGYSQTVANALGESFNHAVLWARGSMLDLNAYLDSSTSSAGWYLASANAINDAGWITGEARNSVTGESHAYLLSVASAAPEPDAGAMALLGVGGVFLVVGKRKRRTFTDVGSSHG